MKSIYLKEDVHPVLVSKPDNEHLKISYKVPMESMFYSKGVDYEINEGVIKVYVSRCEVKKECNPMVTSSIPLDQNWQAEVTIPHHQEKVILMHANGEQVIYPQ